MSDRFPRLCLVHGEELTAVGDSLRCPRGHFVTEWSVGDREKRSLVAKASRDSLSIVAPQEGRMKKNTPKSGGGLRSPVRLQLARFTDGEAQLWLRLTHHGSWSSAPYRLLVRHRADGKTRSGILVACILEEEAQSRFQSACNEARSKGWTDALSGRHGSLLEIPAAASRTPARARAAR